MQSRQKIDSFFQDELWQVELPDTILRLAKYFAFNFSYWHMPVHMS